MIRLIINVEYIDKLNFLSDGSFVEVHNVNRFTCKLL